jgi:hypothetical protein
MQESQNSARELVPNEYVVLKGEGQQESSNVKSQFAMLISWNRDGVRVRLKSRGYLHRKDVQRVF